MISLLSAFMGVIKKGRIRAPLQTDFKRAGVKKAILALGGRMIRMIHISNPYSGEAGTYE